MLQSYHFVPMVVETAEGWHTESLQKELGSKISAVTADLHETSHLFQHLSVALQIGNALSVWGTSDWNNQKTNGNPRLDNGLGSRKQSI